MEPTSDNAFYSQKYPPAPPAPPAPPPPPPESKKKNLAGVPSSTVVTWKARMVITFKRLQYTHKKE